MDELPPKAAALLAAARRQHEPTEADSQRVRAALAATLAGGSTPDLTHPRVHSVGSGATTPGLLTPTLGKLALLAGLLGGTAALWSAWPSAPVQHARAPRTRAERVLPTDAAPRDTAAMPQAHPLTPAVATPAPLVQPEITPPLAPAQPRDQTRPRPARRRGPAAPSHSPEASAEPRTGALGAASPVPPTGLAAPTSDDSEHSAGAAPASLPAQAPGETRSNGDELALIRSALARLNAGDAEQALLLLERHAVRYPQGVMAEERQGLRAIALCATDRRDEGVVAQGDFLRQAPSSALASRVQSACPRSKP